MANSYPTFGLYFRRYAPFQTFGAASPVPGRYEGDNRTKASTSLKVSARTYGCIMFNQFGVVHKFAGADKTVFHPLILNDVVGQAKVAFSVVRQSLAGPGLFALKASTAASMPLLPGSPDIDTYVNVRIDFGAPKLLRLEGEVFGDNFPSLEVFTLCYRSARTALLVDGRTTGGRDTGPIMRVPGAHAGQPLAKFQVKLSLSDNGELASNTTTGSIALP